MYSFLTFSPIKLLSTLQSSYKFEYLTVKKLMSFNDITGKFQTINSQQSQDLNPDRSPKLATAIRVRAAYALKIQ